MVKPTPNPKVNVVRLTDQQREFLRQKTKSGKWSPREVQRAHIFLLSDENGPDALSDNKIADRVDCTPRTVVGRRKRFTQVENIEDAVVDKPRTGRPTIVDGAVEAHMTKIACSAPPKGHARWTLGLIRDRMVTLKIVDSISCQTVNRQLKKKSLSHG